MKTTKETLDSEHAEFQEQMGDQAKWIQITSTQIQSSYKFIAVSGKIASPIQSYSIISNLSMNIARK